MMEIILLSRQPHCSALSFSAWPFFFFLTTLSTAHAWEASVSQRRWVSLCHHVAGLLDMFFRRQLDRRWILVMLSEGVFSSRLAPGTVTLTCRVLMRCSAGRPRSGYFTLSWTSKPLYGSSSDALALLVISPCLWILNKSGAPMASTPSLLTPSLLSYLSCVVNFNGAKNMTAGHIQCTLVNPCKHSESDNLLEIRG